MTGGKYMIQELIDLGRGTEWAGLGSSSTLTEAKREARRIHIIDGKKTRVVKELVVYDFENGLRAE